MAEKVHQEKLKGVQTRLTYGESSRQKAQTKEKTQLSESESCVRKRKTKKRRSPSPYTMSRSTRPGRSPSIFSRLRQRESSSTCQRSPVSTTVFTRLGARDRNVFTRLGEKKKDIHSRLSPKVASRQKHASDRRRVGLGWSVEDRNHSGKDARNLVRSYVTCSSKRLREIKEEWDAVNRANRRRPTRTENMYISKSKYDDGGHWKSKSKKQRSINEEDPSQPWLCEETNPFMARIRNFEVPKRTHMPTNVKTYDRTGEPEDHLKIFQTTAKIERWAIPTWCHITTADFGSAEGQNKNKFCEFHEDKGHNTDECIHLRKQIEEAVKSGQLSHMIKELKQGGNKGKHAKTAKKGETSNKEKTTVIFVFQPWKRITRQKITQSFSESQEISLPHLESNDGQENPMAIKAEVESHLIHRMYVDGGSASEVLCEQCFNRLCLKVKSRMTPTTTLLLGFSGEISWPLGHISLMVSLGDKEHSTDSVMNFMIVRSLSQYNGIISRSGLKKIQAILSTAHGMLKFQVEGGIVMLYISIIIPAKCRMAKAFQRKEGMELCNWLRNNLDIFAWKPAYMTGVPRSIAKRHLNIREGCPSIRQKRRGQVPDRNKAIQEEVAKLVEAHIMREVHYHNWLSSPVIPKEDQHETKPQEMNLWSIRRDVPGTHCKHEGNKSMPGKSRSSHETAFTENAERGTKP
ncbi:reverse transcriptase domain-containing protein [Tanacetum coccineum]